MGIDIGVKLLFGVEFSILEREVSEEVLEAINEQLDGGELDHASPHYDSPRKYWIVGNALRTRYDYAGEIVREVVRATAELEELGFPIEHCQIIAVQNVY